MDLFVFFSRRGYVVSSSFDFSGDSRVIPVDYVSAM